MEENITSSVITDTHQNGISFFGTKKRKLNLKKYTLPPWRKIAPVQLQHDFALLSRKKLGKAGRSSSKDQEIAVNF